MLVSSTAKIHLIAVGILIACNVVCIAWFLVSQARSSLTALCGPEVKALSPEKITALPGNMSSKAHWVLKVSLDDSYTDEPGPVAWEPNYNSRGIRLKANGTQVAVDDSGYYVVYVQGVFVLTNESGDGSRDGVIRLNLCLNTTDSRFASWDEREVTNIPKNETSVVQLRFLVLVGLRKDEHISVLAKHRKDLEYQPPFSTFLSIFRYSDLEEDDAQ